MGDDKKKLETATPEVCPDDTSKTPVIDPTMNGPFLPEPDLKDHYQFNVPSSDNVDQSGDQGDVKNVKIAQMTKELLSFIPTDSGVVTGRDITNALSKMDDHQKTALRHKLTKAAKLLSHEKTGRTWASINRSEDHVRNGEGNSELGDLSGAIRLIDHHGFGGKGVRSHKDYSHKGSYKTLEIKPLKVSGAPFNHAFTTPHFNKDGTVTVACYNYDDATPLRKGYDLSDANHVYTFKDSASYFHHKEKYPSIVTDRVAHGMISAESFEYTNNGQMRRLDEYTGRHTDKTTWYDADHHVSRVESYSYSPKGLVTATNVDLYSYDKGTFEKQSLSYKGAVKQPNLYANLITATSQKFTGTTFDDKGLPTGLISGDSANILDSLQAEGKLDEHTRSVHKVAKEMEKQIAAGDAKRSDQSKMDFPVGSDNQPILNSSNVQLGVVRTIGHYKHFYYFAGVTSNGSNEPIIDSPKTLENAVKNFYEKGIFAPSREEVQTMDGKAAAHIRYSFTDDDSALTQKHGMAFDDKGLAIAETTEKFSYGDQGNFMGSELTALRISKNGQAEDTSVVFTKAGDGQIASQDEKKSWGRKWFGWIADLFDHSPKKDDPLLADNAQILIQKPGLNADPQRNLAQNSPGPKVLADLGPYNANPWDYQRKDPLDANSQLAMLELQRSK